MPKKVDSHTLANSCSLRESSDSLICRNCSSFHFTILRLSSGSAAIRLYLLSRLSVCCLSTNFQICDCSVSLPGRTVSFSSSAPMRLLPQRRWWSRKLRGLLEATVVSHKESLASSTAMGFKSTP
ncbi:Uncharacterised protein [uncultured archaeon]|nr:Uncharacterised protein [uncultured archaeon]